VVREAVVEACTERPSFGYRRVTAMVRRKLQFAINTKQVRRIMRQENLLLKQPRRPLRQRIPKKPGTIITAHPDESWQMDAKYIFCGNDRWVLAHNIIDTCTTEWVGFLFDRRYRKQECIKLLEQTVLERWPQTGKAPGTRLRLDNHGSQTCDEFVEAAELLGFHVEYIQNHQPEQNGMVESFHACLQRDYLDLVDLESEAQAAKFLAEARLDYNKIKPKQRLGWRTPRQFYEEVTKNATSNC
jgi:putative transposase